ncbi:hypothetical protein SapgrDRAFT_2470 [Saprospira grandis DSM 2844]|uniref:Uncharacterized protein n=1 Tax=Saprospira grandis DSM 2844 TaxID=694433 RepID=J0P2Y1_9BACT|nr:hypothetical protein [Saprospira grandis]EJF54129.1 hypothetical protein SapgrDRAFT_2470 [Saprospira grandis DSM 2844]
MKKTLAQYLELHSLYQELPAEDPDRPSLKAALLKTKAGLKAFKPQLKMEKANLEQLFLALKEEDIPKERYRQQLALFFADLQQGVSSRLGKKPALKTGVGLIKLRSDLVLFFNQVPGPLSKQLHKEIKVIPIDTNVEDFLAAFLAILEKYSQEDQIKANWFNTFSIKEENLLKKISYQQLESILDQALAKDDFLTEEELIEQQKKDLLLLEEKLAGVISYIKMKINNEYDLLPAAEEYFKYKIKSTSCISNLTAARQGIHPKLHAYLFQNWAAAIQAEQEYDPQLLKKILLDNTKLPKDFAENWFKEDMAIAKINEQELLANNWSTGCFVKEQLLLEIKDEEAKKWIRSACSAWISEFKTLLRQNPQRCINKDQFLASLEHEFMEGIKGEDAFFVYDRIKEVVLSSKMKFLNGEKTKFSQQQLLDCVFQDSILGLGEEDRLNTVISRLKANPEIQVQKDYLLKFKISLLPAPAGLEYIVLQASRCAYKTIQKPEFKDSSYFVQLAFKHADFPFINFDGEMRLKVDYALKNVLFQGKSRPAAFVVALNDEGEKWIKGYNNEGVSLTASVIEQKCLAPKFEKCIATTIIAVQLVVNYHVETFLGVTKDKWIAKGEDPTNSTDLSQLAKALSFNIGNYISADPSSWSGIKEYPSVRIRFDLKLSSELIADKVQQVALDFKQNQSGPWTVSLKGDSSWREKQS